MELTDSLKSLLIETAASLKGHHRRLFIARTVKQLGPGSQRRAERELGWNRVTIRKGTHELESSFICLDAFATRGRKRAEDHLPTLLDASREIVDGQRQHEPQFRSKQLVHALKRHRSASPAHRSKRLYGRSIAPLSNDHDQTQ